MTKRLTALTLTILITLLLLAGCSDNENSELVGTWTPITANINGETIQFSELETDEDSFRFTFESNGSCTLVLAGIENHGSYVFNKTSVDVSYGGKTEKLLYDEGILTLNFYYNNETTSFMFTKQK